MPKSMKCLLAALAIGIATQAAVWKWLSLTPGWSDWMVGVLVAIGVYEGLLRWGGRQEIVDE